MYAGCDPVWTPVQEARRGAGSQGTRLRFQGQGWSHPAQRRMIETYAIHVGEVLKDQTFFNPSRRTLNNCSSYQTPHEKHALPEFSAPTGPAVTRPRPLPDIGAAVEAQVASPADSGHIGVI